MSNPFNNMSCRTDLARSQLVIQSAWFDWWGGWSFGYRQLVDAVPLLIMLLIPVLKKPPASRALGALAAGLLSFSVGVQLVGAFAYDVRSWNARVGYPVTVPGEREPVIVLEEAEASALVANVEGAMALAPIRMDVDVLKYRHRLWSIRDNPLTYYATHFSEARARKRQMTEAFISKW